MSEIQAGNQGQQQMVRYSGPPVRRAGGPQPGPGLTGKDIWRIIRKRKWMIIIPTILTLVLFVAGTVLWLAYAPFYTATAVLSIKPPTGGAMVGSRLASTDIIERLVASHAQMVTRERVLRKAIASPDVSKTRWFSSSKSDAVKRLGKALSVSPIPNTNLIRVSVTTTNRLEVADIATAVAEAYITVSEEITRADSAGLIKSLTSEADQRQAELNQLRGERQRIMGAGGTGRADMESRSALLKARLQILGRQLIQLKLSKAEAEAARDALKTQFDAGVLKDAPEVVAALEGDPRLRTLRQEEMNLSVSRDNAVRKYGPKHRIVQDMETNLASVMKRIEEREKDVIAYQTAALMSMREATVTAITASTVAVQEEYNRISAELEDAGKIMIEIAVLEEKAKALESRIKRIGDRLMELRVESKGQQLVSLGGYAETPLKPSMPQWKIMIPSGIVLGLLVGMGLAFLLEFMDTSIKSPGDVSRRFDMPVLGMVPHIDDVDEEIGDIRKLFTTSPSSLINESFRRIRTCLLYSAPAEHRKVVLVTSAQPEDGRTSVTMNLAAAIAHSGGKVLVVDTNFRQPAVSQLFADSNPSTRGLCDVLVGQNEWRDVVHEVEANIHVIATGPMPPNPAELLGSQRMRQFLAEASGEYDQVLLDGAPCLVVSDATVLSTVADGIIFVIRAGVNTYGIVQRAREILASVGARMLGVVLNGVRVTAGGYLKESYETFYEYQSQGQLPAE